MYSSFSMLIWGLIMAKAKSGYSAAVSKDHPTVKSSYKNIFTILVLVVIACAAQMKFESSFKELAKPDDNQVESSKGRNLAMVQYESDEEATEVIDYRDLLNKVAAQWES